MARHRLKGLAMAKHQLKEYVMAKHPLKECAMVKHQLKDNKKSWQGWKNISKPDDETSHLTMILRIKVG